MAALKPDQLEIEQCAVTPRSFNAHASTRIDQNEFGVTAYRGLAARYLDISVEVRCVRS
jgi:polyisoprenoid-binding protein YceI